MADNAGYIQQEQARIKAIKQTLGQITAGSEEEAQAAAGGVAAQKQAAELRGKNAAEQAALQGGLQLAQQTGQGMGYNKAAARQTATTVGATGGAAIGEAQAQGILGAQEAGEKAAKAKTEAVAQKLEQLKTEQELASKQRDLSKSIKADLAAQEQQAIQSTKGTWDDDEEGAIQNLINVYNNNKGDYDADPAAKEQLAIKMAGIRKNAGSGWDGADVEGFITSTLGLSPDVYKNAPELDY